MDARKQTLVDWLTNQSKIPVFNLQPLQGDASFRRYFRATVPDGSYVVMDAPPERENCVPFVAIANALRAIGVCTPEIKAADIAQGFLVLSDFGSQLYLHELAAHNALELYSRALDTLAVLQTCRQVDGWTLPHFTANFMRNELELFKEWFLQKHLNITFSAQLESQLATTFDFLANAAAAQKQVFMHRDYHSANLMVLPNQKVGVLDFQDAFMGPVTYDLVSLLRDCYIAWPDAMVMQLVQQYHEKINLTTVSADEFLRWFDLMGLQRHLKALLTFSRKYRRDHDANYLQHIPRTLNYIEKISARYPECAALHNLISTQVLACVE